MHTERHIRTRPVLLRCAMCVPYCQISHNLYKTAAGDECNSIFIFVCYSVWPSSLEYYAGAYEHHRETEDDEKYKKIV